MKLELCNTCVLIWNQLYLVFIVLIVLYCIDSKKEQRFKWLVIISTSMNIKRESIGF